MGESLVSYDLVINFDELVKSGEENKACDLLRSNKYALSTLRTHYQSLNPIEIKMKEQVEEGFGGRLERQLAMIGQVIAEM